jgi:hypothetical protein
MSARLVLLAAALLLATASSSSDPDGAGSCLGGMVRDPGPACTLPPALGISLDGQALDWQQNGLDQVLVPGSCCATGDSGLTHAARQRDSGALVFFNHTVGTPVLSTTLVYALVFRRVDLDADDPGNVVTQLLLQPNEGIQVFVNGERVFGPQVEVNLGQEGVEWRVPTGVLPYPGVANVAAVTYELSANGYVARNLGGATAKICWDPEAERDECVK